MESCIRNYYFNYFRKVCFFLGEPTESVEPEAEADSGFLNYGNIFTRLRVTGQVPDGLKFDTFATADDYCYLCGKFIKFRGTKIVLKKHSTICQADHSYFGILIGDQDKKMGASCFMWSLQ